MQVTIAPSGCSRGNKFESLDLYANYGYDLDVSGEEFDDSNFNLPIFMRKEDLINDTDDVDKNAPGAKQC